MYEDLRRFYSFRRHEIANNAIPLIEMVSDCQSSVQFFVSPSVRPSARPSVGIYQRDSQWTDLREI